VHSRCQHEGCVKSAQGDTQHCVLHGGGRRCQHLGCPKAAATSLYNRHAALYPAWRRQALPARRLPQGGCCRRHAELHRA
jgi:hypothetical protein